MARVEIEVPVHKGMQGWWKRVTSVEPGAKNGYGIEGEFLREGFHDLDEGSVLVCVEPVGTTRYDKRGRAYWIEDGKLEPLNIWHDWNKEFVFLRDELTGALEVARSKGHDTTRPAKITATVMADGRVHIKVDQIVSERTADQISALLARDDGESSGGIFDIEHLNHY